MKKASVQIFILSRDRPEYLREALGSALAQTAEGVEIEVIVSDNSETDAVKAMMAEEFPGVRYIRRWPATNGGAHFKKVISEVSRDFVVLFHDDDLLLPGYCERMVAELSSNPEAAAVGCNAYIMQNGKIDNKRKSHRFRTKQSFRAEDAFLKQQLQADEFGTALFPSYTYRNNALSVSDIDPRDGGKYSDISFLSKKLRYGSIIWIPDTLMIYRLHGHNDSCTVEMNDMRKLWRYMVSCGIGRNSALLHNYKMRYWKEWLLGRKIATSSPSVIVPIAWRERIVVEYLLMEEIKKPYRLFFWRLLIGYCSSKLASLRRS